MKRPLFFLSLTFMSLSLFSQVKVIEYINHNITSKLLLVQNNCNNSLIIKLKDQCIDTIKCRTDSIFATISPDYFRFKSYDFQDHLRVDGSLHVHMYSIAPEAKTILTPLYQDSLSADEYKVFDTNGNIVEEVYTLCDFYLPPMSRHRRWEDFGTDEFGTKTTFMKDEIKRMPLDK
jgi:hypothetical protein